MSRPLKERLFLRSHVHDELARALHEMFQAAEPLGADPDTTAEQAAAMLGDDHPTVQWLEVVGLGLQYVDALAEREQWPSFEEDKAEGLGALTARGSA